MTRFTDLIHNSKTVVAVAPQEVATAGKVASEIIDTQGFYALMLQVGLGDVEGSKVQVEKIEEGNEPDLSDAVEAVDTQIIGELKADNDDPTVVKCINFVPNKRYVKATLKTTGAGALINANAILFGAAIDGKINE